jgi:hypothetical protein
MSFRKGKILKVWNKGKTISGRNPRVYRKDQCGCMIMFGKYGSRYSKFGWEIDHINCNRHDNRIQNLRPLQWDVNNRRSNGRLKCFKAW